MAEVAGQQGPEKGALSSSAPVKGGHRGTATSTVMGDLPQDPLAEAKARRRAAKEKQFRQYLVDSGTYELVVKVLVGIMDRCEEEGPRPINAEELITDIFGSYRDPRWDEVESLWDSIETEKGKKAELTDRIADLQDQVEQEQKRAGAVRLWRALGGLPDAELPGKDLVTRIVGPLPKKPPDPFVEAGEPPASITLSLWVERMVQVEEEVRAWACEGLLEQLTASEEPPYKDNFEDEQLLAFLRALSSQFQPPPAAEE